MRNVPSNIASKLAMKKQTRANKADPSASIWIGRPTTPLTENTFLERQTVINAPVTDVSVAVCHPRLGKSNTKTYLAYISNGKAKVFMALNKAKMSNHIWSDTGFSEDATSVSIAFDGTMPKTEQGIVEFVTEQEPWIFWSAPDGKLYGRQLGTITTVILAEANCTDVSAVRAMWSEVGSFDFGLVVFFILSGTLFYRQLINKEWMDAEVVSYGPSSVFWSKIAAFRTWDYRVGVQGKTTSGDIYELFTQFMGIGKQLTEHIVKMNKINAHLSLTGINYIDIKEENEAIKLNSISSNTLYGGLYSVLDPKIIYAKNEPILNDWGLKIIIKFDIHLELNSVESNFMNFKLQDSKGMSFTPYSTILQNDGLSIEMLFTNFNNAFGQCKIIYTPGSVKSMMDVNVLYREFSFLPTNLEPIALDPPGIVDIFNF